LGLVAGVHVASFLGGSNSGSEDLFGFSDAPEAREELAVLEIAGDVVRMGREQLLEVPGCRFVIGELRAFKCQAVAREGVVRIRGDEPFEDFPASLLRLGHGSKARIIAVAQGSAKRSFRGQDER